MRQDRARLLGLGLLRRVLVGLGREMYRGCLNRMVVVVIARRREAGIEGMVLESAREKDHRIGVVVGRHCFAAVEV